jgi:hypothetical protein
VCRSAETGISGAIFDRDREWQPRSRGQSLTLNRSGRPFRIRTVRLEAPSIVLRRNHASRPAADAERNSPEGKSLGVGVQRFDPPLSLVGSTCLLKRGSVEHLSLRTCEAIIVALHFSVATPGRARVAAPRRIPDAARPLGRKESPVIDQRAGGVARRGEALLIRVLYPVSG